MAVCGAGSLTRRTLPLLAAWMTADFLI